MKKLAIVMIAIAGLLSGCVAYDFANRDGHSYRGDGTYSHAYSGPSSTGGTNYMDGRPYSGDRDRDGVPITARIGLR